MRVLFVTRKYPPKIGGMESLSHSLLTGFPEPKTTITLRRSQKHLIWFFTYWFCFAKKAYRLKPSQKI